MERYRVYTLYFLLNGRHCEGCLVEIRGLDPPLHLTEISTPGLSGGENLRSYWRRKLSKIINRFAARGALDTQAHNNTITHLLCLVSPTYLAFNNVRDCWTRDGLFQGFPGAGAHAESVTRAGAKQRVGLKYVFDKIIRT